MQELILPLTTDKVQVVTSTGADCDTVASFVDMSQANPPVPQGTTTSVEAHNITGSGTQDIVASPGATTTRIVKGFTVCNIDASLSTDVTVNLNRNATLYRLFKCTLDPGFVLKYTEGIGFFVYEQQDPRETFVKLTSDLASTTLTSMSDVTGISLPVLTGNYYRFKFFHVYQSSGTSIGLKSSVTFPAATIFAANVTIPLTSDAAAAMFFGTITSSDDPVIATTTPLTTTNHVAITDGVIVPSADGNVVLRQAAETTGGGVTSKQGTLGMLRRWP